jgi:hypothetical protein
LLTSLTYAPHDHILNQRRIDRRSVDQSIEQLGC